VIHTYSNFEKTLLNLIYHATDSCRMQLTPSVFASQPRFQVFWSQVRSTVRLLRLYKSYMICAIQDLMREDPQLSRWKLCNFGRISCLTGFQLLESKQSVLANHPASLRQKISYC